MPSPVQMSALVLGSKTRPRPPVATMTALARTTWMLARPDVQQYGAAALAVPDDQGQHEPFLVDAHARLHHLLV